MFGAIFNTRLEQVRARQDRSSGGRASIRGEPNFNKVDFLKDHPEVILQTWVDFGVARRLVIAGENIEVKATWEVRDFIQTKVAASAIGRRLRPGDEVKFTTNDRWFKLEDVEEDAGPFLSVPYEKFNLVYSHQNQYD